MSTKAKVVVPDAIAPQTKAIAGGNHVTGFINAIDFARISLTPVCATIVVGTCLLGSAAIGSSSYVDDATASRLIQTVAAWCPDGDCW
jgi:hypothetical protein